MSCPLCRLYEDREIITKLHYEDEFCIIVHCKTHSDKKMCVLKRHIKYPTEEEKKHMKGIMRSLFPGMELRGPKSILDHYHLHEV